MDYIRLKKTLIAVFDHFLSCHDMAELERMMQAFEAGKSLVIKLPEPVEREDYRDDAFTHEEQIKSDDIDMAAPELKKTISRIRRKKPQATVKTDMKHIKICDVPVLIDLKRVSKEKREALRDVLSGDHHVTIHDFKMTDIHGFAKARIFTVRQDHRPPEGISQSGNSSFFDGEQIKQKAENASDQCLRENLIEKIMFEIKKYKDPP